MNIIFNKKILFVAVLILVYLIGVGIVLINKPDLPIETKVTNKENFKGAPVVDGTSFKIDPPSQAKVGTLNIVSSTVEKYARFADDWEEIASTSGILQEEKIRTGKSGKAVVKFLNHLNIIIAPETEVYFANLLPDSLLLEQSEGEVTYTAEKPISIKSIDTLTSFEQGKLTLGIDPDNNFIYLNVASGSGKFSFIDNDNQTRIFEIEKGNRVIYNPKNTSITIR